MKGSVERFLQDRLEWFSVSRVCFVEAAMGAAGDMLVAGLLDSGASRERVMGAMEAAGELGDVEVVIREVEKQGVRGTRVEVSSTDREERSLDEVLDYLDTVDLPGAVMGTARNVFRRLGAAEEEVHGDAVFHRVGAADAVADVLGASAAYHDLGLDGAQVLVGPVCVGGGTTAEGYPVPGPAALNLLRDAELEWRGGPFETELLTPTGAALLAELCDGSTGYAPSMVTERVGVGAGSKDLERPNVVRVVLGRSRDLAPDQLVFLETAVDDATGEEISFAVKRSMEEGARDASVIDMDMKKGRKGQLVRVAAKPGDAERLAETLYRELGTLGVRHYPVEHRLIASREVRTVEIELKGETEPVRVKVATGPDGVESAAAEYDDAEALAEKHGVPLRRVMRLAERQVR